MSQTASKSLTYQTRLHIEENANLILREYACLLSHTERCLFKDYYQKSKNINDLKSSYLKKFNITARQFNSCRIKLQGKVRSYKAILKDSIVELESKIKKLKRHIKKIKDPFKVHQKKRRLFQLEQKLTQKKQDLEENKLRICFGSKKLFRKQFHLEENGFSSHLEWKALWEEKRNDSFFIVGSKDETAGNQTCQLIKNKDTFSVHLRLPNGFSEKTLVIENITFGYGREEIERALLENEIRYAKRLSNEPYSHLGKAINFLFKVDHKGWRVFVTVEKEKPPLISDKKNGMIGVDININHLALVETDPQGNIIDKKTIPCAVYGKSKNQTLAIIGDAVQKITKLATQKQKPISFEKLDFSNKKQTLREKNNKYSRMLSSFAYSKICSFIEMSAFKAGIEIFQVNPAFTSIIGKIKFTKQYGLSTHHAASLVLARRALRFSERLPRYLEILDGGSKSAFFLSAGNREKHVWSQYRELIKMLKATDVQYLSSNIRSARRESLLWDSNAVIYRGSSGTLIVSNTVRFTCQNKSIRLNRFV